MDEGHAGLIKWKHLYKIGSIGIIFLSMWKNYQWRHLSLEFLVSESFNHRFNFCGRYSDFLSHVVFGIWHTCQKSFDWIREGLFQSSLHPVPWVYACLHAYTTLFWLLLVCSKLWNQEVRPPVFFFFFSGLFWLLGVLWDSTWTLEWGFLYLPKKKNAIEILTGAVLNL